MKGIKRKPSSAISLILMKLQSRYTLLLPTIFSLKLYIDTITNLRFNDLFLIWQVMCPTCLCTGMAMASEHDPRIDPFD